MTTESLSRVSPRGIVRVRTFHGGCSEVTVIFEKTRTGFITAADFTSAGHPPVAAWSSACPFDIRRFITERRITGFPIITRAITVNTSLSVSAVIGPTAIATGGITGTAAIHTTGTARVSFTNPVGM